MLNYIYFLDVNDKACTFSQDEVEKFVSIDTRSGVYWMVRKVVVIVAYFVLKFKFNNE